VGAGGGKYAIEVGQTSALEHADASLSGLDALKQ
jgi:hypothetical protein